MGYSRGKPAVREDRPTRVLIVDDHELLAHLVGKTLVESGFEVEVVTGPSLGEILPIARGFQPDVCLLDLDLGPAGNGRSFVRPLSSLGCSVILLTASRDRAAVGEVLEIGAFGALTKNEPPERLRSAIMEAAAGREEPFAPERQELLVALRDKRAREKVRLAAFERLTPREREVLAELSRGRTAAVIAEASFVSLSTVRSQIRSVLTKLGVTSQLAAVALAHELEWS